jgi:2-keto-3-deoxy-L-arabinonate dehydratase
MKMKPLMKNALRRLIDFAIASGLKAVCLPAYASEFYKLTDEERLHGGKDCG